MAAWEMEHELEGPVLDMSRRTPSLASRPSRGSATPQSASPPPVSEARAEPKRLSRDFSNDETISMLDPRRFTPTLHANLVAEMLSLKRDQEEKNKVIESLEMALQSTRDDFESRQATLISAAKEARSLKRQFALLEGGTSSAIAELARERDEAESTAGDVRKRLEAALKKLRSTEEDSTRVHSQLAGEKEAWEQERRMLERKVHVAESRLKAVLNEVAALQADQEAAAQEGELDAADGVSIRTMSLTNTNRFSVLPSHERSLADELSSLWDGDTDGSEPSNHQHARTMSRDSILSRTHRRGPSTDSLTRPGSVALSRLAMRDRLEDDTIREDDEKPVAYVDRGVQFTPPTTPKTAPRSQECPVEIEANQRRKRVHFGPPLAIKGAAAPGLMVNGPSQTADAPLSPPETPEAPMTPLAKTPAVLMVSASTQTHQPPSNLSIPFINIIPPTSRPSTPREPLLPPLSKSVSCQVSLPSVSVRSMVVQTDEIRIDTRLNKLPPHLHPSAITSRPNSTVFPDPPPRSPLRRPAELSLADSSPPTGSFSHAGYDNDNDDPPRRPLRLSSLFGGFEGYSSDEVEELVEADFTDSELPEYRTALSPRPKAGSGKFSSGDCSSSSSSSSSSQGDATVRTLGGVRNSRNRLSGVLEEATGPTRPARAAIFGPSKPMLPPKVMQNGFAAQRRSRSPKRPDSGAPPFPIPKRASSRLSVSSVPSSEGTRSPTRRRKVHRAGSVRKGSVALSRNSRTRPWKRSQSPAPPLPLLSPGPLSPQLSASVASKASKANSVNTALSATTAIESESTATGGQTGVVDAIAQTMVGEWMYKYVRRRKSFAKSDVGREPENSNDRHRRWVWIAPYERSILWSNKQPVSGSALMGKADRKLVIQSVLDVKDHNPPPRGSGPLFNRSVIVLTPHRALKFTAPTADRHYLWLTALSFLAHSQQAVPEIPMASPPSTMKSSQSTAVSSSLVLPKTLHVSPAAGKPAPASPKPRIRDSIRLAKAKTAVPSPTPLPSQPPRHARETSHDSAQPPAIPRFGSATQLRERADPAPTPTVPHARKRSNTGGLLAATTHAPPPLSFRGFSSGRPPSKVNNNLLDTLGTVCMEAFISPLSAHGEPLDEDGHDRQQQYGSRGRFFPVARQHHAARRRSKEARRMASRSKDSVESCGPHGLTDDIEQWVLRDDPFRGF